MLSFQENLIEGAMADKAKKSGISVATLRKVYNRGVAAWKTGHRPGTTPQQWGHARVNAFIAKKKSGKKLNHDTDLAHTEHDGEILGEGDFAVVSTNGPMISKKSKVHAYVKTMPKGKNLDKLLDKHGADTVIHKDKMKKSNISEDDEHDNCGTDACCGDCETAFDHVIEETVIMEDGEKKGVKLNDPIRTSENPNKKFKVYVRDPQTKKIKVVRFGDPNMEIKRDDPARRKNFRARHNCDNPGPKTKARYWSCYQWRGGKKVDS